MHKPSTLQITIISSATFFSTFKDFGHSHVHYSKKDSRVRLWFTERGFQKGYEYSSKSS